MQLHYNIASPFVRKVLVAAIETGLDGRIERMERMPHPVKPDPGLTRANPLGKVPCLITDDGAVLYDSRVICEYLDGLHDGPKLFPPRGPERFAALRRQALGDGIMDAGVLVRYETWARPDALRWPEWIEQQKGKFRRALDVLEAEAGELDGPLDIGKIAIGCALGYLDFRYGDERWREARPGLAGWFERFAARPAMTGTAPRETW